jgi:hypothetical protein
MAETFDPTTVRINRISGEDRLRIRFEFSSPEKRKPISWEITFDDGMHLLYGLKDLQAKHKIPIPPSLRPSGKPKLVVVTNDEV